MALKRLPNPAKNGYNLGPARLARLLEVVKLLNQGIQSPDVIADRLGITVGGARTLKEQAYAYLVQNFSQEAETWRAYEMSQLMQLEKDMRDELLTPGLNSAARINILNSLARLSESRAKLQGLYTLKIEQRQEETINIQITPPQAGDILARMEAAGALMAANTIEGEYTEEGAPLIPDDADTADSQGLLDAADSEES